MLTFFLDAFGTDSNFPFPSPIAPAPGPSLLDDNESKFLDSFFDGVSSDQLDYDFFMNAGDSFLNPGWQELPPTFMGTTSSFGQHPSHSQSHPPPPPVTSSGQIMNYKAQDMTYKARDVAFNNDMNGNLGMDTGLPMTTSPDVVMAAATLLHNGSNGRSHSMGNDSIFGMTPNNNMGPANGHNMHPSLFTSQTPRPPVQEMRPSSREMFMRDTFYSDLVFGETVPETIAAADDILRPKKNSKVAIRWGSDAGFANEQSFVPPADQETAEEVEKEHLRRMKEFANDMSITPVNAAEIVGSNGELAPIRPTSPQRRKSLAKLKTDDEDSRSRKRRKTKYVDEDNDEESPISATGRQSGASIKKRKSMSRMSPSSPSESSGRRKKSSSSANNKAARENLTEIQKRENHIKSEQKRRTLIREGFDDLGELVPGLRGGGFSKSAVLVMAADWLEELLKGNEELRGRVTDLERGG